jgi:hypothetical protein
MPSGFVQDFAGMCQADLPLAASHYPRSSNRNDRDFDLLKEEDKQGSTRKQCLRCWAML